MKRMCESFCCISSDYPGGIRAGLVFSDIWGDVIVSDRQDKSMSRASILFWMSAVRRCRASCKTLQAHAKQKVWGNKKRWLCTFYVSLRCSSPQLLKGLVYMLLQNPLHSLDELHFFVQLLLHGISDKLVPSPTVPQRQAFPTDLQGNSGGSQRLFSLLLRLAQNTARLHMYFGSLTHTFVLWFQF